MFQPVSSKPDLVGREHEVLTLWRERRTFARLRAQNAGKERWSFLDGPITANNPMGVHHAWGRAYKDLFQRFWAMHGRDQRYQNGFDCQGLWVEVNVERDLGFTSKRDIEAYGIAEFVSLCKQRVLTYAARQTEQSIRLGMWMDWNDPHELRRLRDELAEDPARPVTTRSTDGTEVSDTAESLVGRLGMPELGGSYFTFSNENNYLIWSFIAECHRRGWLYKGHDTMPWCARCGTGISQHEMTEGYADREDPGLTVKFPLLDRPGEALLVWTTTPWTLTSNVAAAVGEDLRYVKVQQGDESFWLGRGTLKQALEGPFQIVEEKLGRELAGWRYSGPFDELPAVQAAFEAGASAAAKDGPYEHRVVTWAEVGEDEGTGIVHIAPGCGAEDFALGKSLGLPMIAPLDENGVVVAGFGPFSGRDVRDVAEPILESLKHRHRFYRLETITHRYPHCWRCGTPLVFRLVDEWYISMGPVYDVPRDQLTPGQVDASLRYQIMNVIRDIKWIPGFGYERELDWLLNMHDWMISKKRYWGLALPIYDCSDCGAVTVVGGREELAEQAVEGWAEFEGHTPHRPYVDAVKVKCSGCGAPVSRITDVGNPWLDAGIVPFSTMHYRSDPEYWKQWFPADFVTESFPGQFRNWFYSLLAMSTVLRRETPFKTLFGYALVFGEDGRQMHKSWGNAIEFDEAAERMGADVMRWMFANARPEDNINFGWHAADEARRRLLVLWNVYSFFVTYARLAEWTPTAPAPAVAERGPLDRWILARVARLAATVESQLKDYDALDAAREIDAFVEELSTWYLRRSRDRMRASAEPLDRMRAFSTLHEVLVALTRIMAPILPFLSESIYQNLVVAGGLAEAPDSVHLTSWPTAELKALDDRALQASMDVVTRAVDLARTLRSQVGIKTRQPLARMWLAMPGPAELVDQDALLELLKDEVNVKSIELIGDESQLVDRRVKPLLPKIGKKLGAAIPAVMAAARDGHFEILADGSVIMGGVTLAPDEVEIQATPRPGTAVAHDEGLVVVIDTEMNPQLLAEGDARELQRAIQDTRKEAAVELDDEVAVQVEAPEAVSRTLEPYLRSVETETRSKIQFGPMPAGVTPMSVDLDSGSVLVGLLPTAIAP
jgi:isoleucyl-tRNA synthetase